MRARTRIDTASYPPAVVKAMGEAFDQAWNQIAANYGDHAKRVEVARLKLADAVLRIASQDSVDVDALRIGALQKMAEDQPCNIGSPQKT